MSNNIGQNCASINKGEPWEPISQVIVKGDKHTYTAGTTTGRTMEVDCGIGTQTIADNLLSALNGFVYQPYDAKDVLIKPSIELGQTISVGNVYSIVASMTIKGDMILAADVSAPSSGDVDHEYPYDEWKKTVDAKNIRHGGGGGTMDGEGITDNSITTDQTNGYINTGLSNAYYSADVFAGTVTADYGKFSHGTIANLNATTINYQSHACQWRKASDVTQYDRYVMCYIGS